MKTITLLSCIRNTIEILRDHPDEMATAIDNLQLALEILLEGGEK
ncbi:MAG: hypothetical protein AB2L14_25480 [Candidatus Xenobiia bacterium LiM19]